MKRKVITPPQCQWMPVPNGYGVRLYSSASDVADTVRGAQQEIDRLHRRLWETRKRAVLAELSVVNMEATDMHQCEFGTSKDAERAKVALRRFWKVSRMEYKP